jgi:hypothetical protein
MLFRYLLLPLLALTAVVPATGVQIDDAIGAGDNLEVDLINDTLGVMKMININ